MNDPRQDPDAQFYNLKLNVQRTHTLQQLKDQVSIKIEVPCNGFYLIRSVNDQPLKELGLSLAELNLQNHSMVRVRLGEPKAEGTYGVELHEIVLRDGLPDNKHFDQTLVCQLEVKAQMTGHELKALCSEKYKERFGESPGDFMLRNPNHDIGQIIRDEQIVEKMYFFDGKSIYLQKLCERYVPYPGGCTESLQVLVREWDPETWALSPLKMIQVPKKAKMHDFG